MPLKLWDQHKNWQEAEAKWDSSASLAAKERPLKLLKNFPSMPGITEEARRHLRWKSLKWMVMKDRGFKILKGFLRHPIFHLKNYFRSLSVKEPYKLDGDFFFYGIDSVEAFSTLLQKPNTLFVLGFSYCEKPFECPSGRFTDACIHDLSNPVCRQCFIGKCLHAAPTKDTVPLLIPTVHYIGEKIFELQASHPSKEIVFLITACEMTLKMFADWGNMVGIKGIGVRLDGRICNTMKAFQLSEEGIKPGLTVVLEGTQEKMLELIRERRNVEIGIKGIRESRESKE